MQDTRKFSPQERPRASDRLCGGSRPRASVTACSECRSARWWCSASSPSSSSVPAICPLCSATPGSSSAGCAGWRWTSAPRAASTRSSTHEGIRSEIDNFKTLAAGEISPDDPPRPTWCPTASASTRASAATPTARSPRTSRLTAPPPPQPCPAGPRSFRSPPVPPAPLTAASSAPRAAFRPPRAGPSSAAARCAEPAKLIDNEGRKPSPRRTDEGKMTIWEHLDELRTRLDPSRHRLHHRRERRLDVPRSDSRVALEAVRRVVARAEHPGRSGAQLRRAERRVQGLFQAVAHRRAALRGAGHLLPALVVHRARASTRKRRRSSSPSSSSRPCSSWAGGSSAGASPSR